MLYLYLHKYKEDSGSRNKSITNIMKDVQEFLQSSMNEEDATNEFKGIPFNHSRVYFWIQIVYMYIAQYVTDMKKHGVTDPKPTTFYNFVNKYPTLLNDSLIFEYYSEEVLESDTAISDLVLTDLKQFPSITILCISSLIFLDVSEEKTFTSFRLILFFINEG